MGAIFFNAAVLFGRILKGIMVVLVVPLAVGLLQSILEQLALFGVAGLSVRELIGWGFGTYVGLHVVLYRPVPLFRASHQLFAALAAWLFGGQVSTVRGAGGMGRGKASKSAAAADSAAQGSTLVAFSPYVVPSYLVLVCVLSWALTHWVDRSWVDAPAAVLIGMTIAFHWLMTADALQLQRDRWHVETYLLAVSLIFTLTLLVIGACLPLAVPEFSFLRALADGMSRTQVMYTTIVQQLFF